MIFKRLKAVLLVPFMVFVLWWGGSYLGLWNSFLLPSPHQVLSAAWEMVLNGELLRNLSSSLARIVWGFFISSLIALPMGAFLGLHPVSACYMYSVLEFLRHVPPLSLLPLLILWCGIGEMSKTVLIVLATFFPVFLNSLDGVRRCDPKLIEVGRTLRFSEFEIFRRIIFPSSLPFTITGLRLGLGYSWRALIGAEMIAASSGLGYMIHDAEALSRSDVIIVGIFTLGIFGALTDHFFFSLTRSLIPWKEGEVRRDGWD